MLLSQYDISYHVIGQIGVNRPNRPTQATLMNEMEYFGSLEELKQVPSFREFIYTLHA